MGTQGVWQVSSDYKAGQVVGTSGGVTYVATGSGGVAPAPGSPANAVQYSSGAASSPAPQSFPRFYGPNAPAQGIPVEPGLEIGLRGQSAGGTVYSGSTGQAIVEVKPGEVVKALPANVGTGTVSVVVEPAEVGKPAMVYAPPSLAELQRSADVVTGGMVAQQAKVSQLQQLGLATANLGIGQVAPPVEGGMVGKAPEGVWGYVGLIPVRSAGEAQRLSQDLGVPATLVPLVGLGALPGESLGEQSKRAYASLIGSYQEPGLAKFAYTEYGKDVLDYFSKREAYEKYQVDLAQYQKEKAAYDVAQHDWIVAFGGAHTNPNAPATPENTFRVYDIGGQKQILSEADYAAFQKQEAFEDWQKNAPLLDKVAANLGAALSGTSYAASLIPGAERSTERVAFEWVSGEQAKAKAAGLKLGELNVVGQAQFGLGRTFEEVQPFGPPSVLRVLGTYGAGYAVGAAVTGIGAPVVGAVAPGLATRAAALGLAAAEHPTALKLVGGAVLVGGGALSGYGAYEKAAAQDLSQADVQREAAAGFVGGIAVGYAGFKGFEAGAVEKPVIFEQVKVPVQTMGPEGPILEQRQVVQGLYLQRGGAVTQPLLLQTETGKVIVGRAPTFGEMPTFQSVGFAQGVAAQGGYPYATGLRGQVMETVKPYLQTPETAENLALKAGIEKQVPALLSGRVAEGGNPELLTAETKSLKPESMKAAVEYLGRPEGKLQMLYGSSTFRAQAPSEYAGLFVREPVVVEQAGAGTIGSQGMPNFVMGTREGPFWSGDVDVFLRTSSKEFAVGTASTTAEKIGAVGKDVVRVAPGATLVESVRPGAPLGTVHAVDIHYFGEPSPAYAAQGVYGVEYANRPVLLNYPSIEANSVSGMIIGSKGGQPVMPAYEFGQRLLGSSATLQYDVERGVFYEGPAAHRIKDVLRVPVAIKSLTAGKEDVGAQQLNKLAEDWTKTQWYDVETGKMQAFGREQYFGKEAFAATPGVAFSPGAFKAPSVSVGVGVGAFPVVVPYLAQPSAPVRGVPSSLGLLSSVPSTPGKPSSVVGYSKMPSYPPSSMPPSAKPSSIPPSSFPPSAKPSSIPPSSFPPSAKPSSIPPSSIPPSSIPPYSPPPSYPPSSMPPSSPPSSFPPSSFPPSSIPPYSPPPAMPVSGIPLPGLGLPSFGTVFGSGPAARGSKQKPAYKPSLAALVGNIRVSMPKSKVAAFKKGMSGLEIRPIIVSSKSRAVPKMAAGFLHSGLRKGFKTKDRGLFG